MRVGVQASVDIPKRPCASLCKPASAFQYNHARRYASQR
jgi:hypothetical protein